MRVREMMSMFRTKTLQEFENELRAVETQISAHPLSAEKVVQAQSLVAESSDQPREAVEQRLRAAGLPGLEELGRLQLHHTASWWRLHRRRRRLHHRIERRTR